MCKMCSISPVLVSQSLLRQGAFMVYIGATARPPRAMMPPKWYASSNSSQYHASRGPICNDRVATSREVRKMINTIFGIASLWAITVSADPGSAIVLNSCSYDVHLSNTPSANGGHHSINQLLSPGAIYSQVYTKLSNGNGWSIKLSKNTNFGNNIMQYEYTYHDDGTIWFDLSEVDGNPWDGDWEITASPNCTVRQAAYRFPTDDANGEQSCPDYASITVTLCSSISGQERSSSLATSIISASSASLGPTIAMTQTHSPTEAIQHKVVFSSGTSSTAVKLASFRNSTQVLRATAIQATRHHYHHNHQHN